MKDEMKTNPSCDFISRASAIQKIQGKLLNWWTYSNKEYRKGLYEAQDIIEATPSIAISSDDLISRKKLMEYCENQKDKTISNNDIARFPSIESVQREWIKTVDGNGWNEWYVLKCPFCGATIEDKNYRSWEYNFCPHCGNRVKGGKD